MLPMRPATHRLIQPLLVLAVFVADRLTKVWAQRCLEPVGSIRVLPFFHLTYLQNTGAAWGMMRGRNFLLILVSVGLLAALFYLKRRWPLRNLWTHYGLVLVAGGALGNLYDRIRFGGVIDFLDFLVWPVFNVADSCITVGACCLAWGLHAAEKAGSPPTC
jgi:signal peptidase II